MPSGLRVWRNKKLVIDSSSRVGKFLGSFTTDGNTTGNFVDVNIIGKTFFYYAISPDGLYGGPGVVANSGSGSITWDYTITISGSSATPADRVHTIYYGYY